MTARSPRRGDGRLRGWIRAIPRLGRRRARTLICAECELIGGPFTPGEAAHFVALHDELHHGRRREQHVRPGPAEEG